MKHYGADIDVAEGTNIKNLSIPTGVVFPDQANIGELFYKTDVNKLYVCTSDVGSPVIWSDIYSSENSGTGSNLDADTLDGIEGINYLRSNVDDTFNGNLTVTGNVTATTPTAGDNSTKVATTAYVQNEISGLGGGSPSGGGGGSTTLTSSGSITTGDPVIVNSDGTVSSVSGVVEAIGNAAQFISGGVVSPKVIYIGSNQFLIGFLNPAISYQFTVVAGIITGNSIIFGSSATSVTGYSSSSRVVDGYYDPDQGKAVFCWATTAGIYASAITVSGSPPSPTVNGFTLIYNSASPTEITCDYDETNNKGVFAQINSSKSTVHSGSFTLSGTTITPETVFQVDTGSSMDYIGMAVDQSAGKGIIMWEDSSKLYGCVTDYSTNPGTNGTVTLLINVTPAIIEPIYHPGIQKVIGLYYSNYTSQSVNGMMAGVINVNGSDLAITPPQLISTNVSSAALDVAYNPILNEVVLMLYSFDFLQPMLQRIKIDDGGDIETVSRVIVSDLSISTHAGLAYSSDDEKIIFASDNDAIIYVPPNTNVSEENFVGISQSTVSTAQDTTVGLIGSIDSNQTGLIAGEAYYINSTGTLTTQSTDNVYAGVALSATELLIKG